MCRGGDWHTPLAPCRGITLDKDRDTCQVDQGGCNAREEALVKGDREGGRRTERAHVPASVAFILLCHTSGHDDKTLPAFSVAPCPKERTRVLILALFWCFPRRFSGGVPEEALLCVCTRFVYLVERQTRLAMAYRSGATASTRSDPEDDGRLYALYPRQGRFCHGEERVYGGRWGVGRGRVSQ